MRQTFFYTSLRLLLFAVALVLLHLAGANGLLLLFLAALISGALSYVLLARQREAMASAVVNGVGRVRARYGRLRGQLDAGTRAEDTD